MVFCCCIQFPLTIFNVRAIDALDGTFVVDGEDWPLLPRTQFDAHLRCEAAVLVGLAHHEHCLGRYGLTLVDDETCLNVNPVEQHDVVRHREVVVLEVGQSHVVYLQRVAVFVVDLFCNAGMTDAVTVAIYHFYVAVAFGIVVETQGEGEVELTLFEVVAKLWPCLKVPVGVEGILAPDLHLVGKTLAATVAQVLRVDEWRQFDIAIVGLLAYRPDELVADFPERADDIYVLLLCFGGVNLGRIGYGWRIVDVVLSEDFQVGFFQRVGAQGGHQFTVTLDVDGVG